MSAGLLETSQPRQRRTGPKIEKLTESNIKHPSVTTSATGVYIPSLGTDVAIGQG